MTMMQFKKGSSMTNLWTWFIIVFIFILIIAGIQKLGEDLTNNPNANLDAKSVEYIAQINGVPIDDYNKSGTTLYSSEVSVDNNTGEAIKDFSIEYFFAREKTKSYEDRLGKKTIFSMPERIIVTLLGGSKGDYAWAFGVFNWFIWIALGIAFILFVRGIMTK